MPVEAIARAVLLADSRGLVHADRDGLDETKRPIAVPREAAVALGLSVEDDLVTTIRRIGPTILVGTTGVAGTFSEEVVREMASGTDRPIVMPLSNPTAIAEATPDTSCAGPMGARSSPPAVPSRRSTDGASARPTTSSSSRAWASAASSRRRAASATRWFSWRARTLAARSRRSSCRRDALPADREPAIRLARDRPRGRTRGDRLGPGASERDARGGRRRRDVVARLRPVHPGRDPRLTLRACRPGAPRPARDGRTGIPAPSGRRAR